MRRSAFNARDFRYWNRWGAIQDIVIDENYNILVEINGDNNILL